MSVHPLVLCSQILYDVQISEDAKLIETLEQTVEKWKMKYTYLTIFLFQDFSPNWQTGITISTLHHATCDENIFNEFASTAVTPTTHKNMLFYVLNACDIVYSVRTVRTRNGTENNRNDVRFPYIDCADDDVDLVVEGGEETTHLLIGKRFWNAENFEQQKKIYFFKYILDQIYCYIGIEMTYESTESPGTLEGSILYVMEQFFWPYRREDIFLDIGTLSFEEYLSYSPRTFRGTILKN